MSRILQQLEPNCEVQHDVKLYGRNSETDRQIDIVVRAQIAGIDLLTIVQCKDYQRRVDVNKVHELVGVMQDVGAHRGVLVANSGFSKSAKTLARRSGIDLWSIHDAESVDWRLSIRLPVIIEAVDLNVELSGAVEIKGPVSFNRQALADPMIAKELNELVMSEPFLRDRAQEVTLTGGPFALTSVDGVSHLLEGVRARISAKSRWFLRYFEDLPAGKAVQWQDSDKVMLLASGASFELPSDAIPYRTREEIPVDARVSLVATRIPTITNDSFQTGNMKWTGPLQARPAP